MKAGVLNRWVTFEKYEAATDTDGNQLQDSDGNLLDPEWIDAFEVSTSMPCQITPLRGRELIAAAAVQSKVTHELRVRYRTGFSATMRGRDGNLIYNIEAVVGDANAGTEYITLLCSSGVNQGGTA